MRINDIAREISKLNSSEINELSEILMKYNISATIYNFSTLPITDELDEPVVNNNNYQQNYTLNNNFYKVHMVDAGNRKLAVVKLAKEIFGLGLRDAKHLIDRTPCMLAENLSYSDAIRMKRGFEDIGADIVIQD